MTKHSNLITAKKEKNDEFYTRIEDIENELQHYTDFFEGKIVFLNCDDPEESNFWKYFELNFEHLKLKKLISTHYEVDKPSYKLEIVGDINGDGKVTKADIIKTLLKQNGDFRSPEAIEILKECDVVVTNPPFSLFREYIAQLMEFNKKFLVIGNMNAIGYKEISPLFQQNKIWLGLNSVKEFIQPDGTVKKFGNILWYTNIDNKNRHEEIPLYKTYNGHEDEYPKYDNCNAIEVSKCKDIPCDYNGYIGVPITFLTKYNPEQFEIIKFRKGDDDKDLAINGKTPYFRILIKRRK